MKYNLAVLSLIFCCGLSTRAFAQCAPGEVSVTMDVMTDMYGYEIYWNLVPAGNACGVGSIGSGGSSVVSCNGAGDQVQDTSAGYGNHMTYNVGPWCLQQDAAYTIFYTDDWGDGGAHFTVYVGGYPVYPNLTGSGDAPSGTQLTFNASLPLTSNIDLTGFNMPLYAGIGATNVQASVFNYSSSTVTSFDFNYSVNGGSVITETVSGVNIAPFTSYAFTSSSPLAISTNGTYVITGWVSNPNGIADMDASNDTAEVTVDAGPPVPDLIAQYLNTTPAKTVISTSSDLLNHPRDLDFHPVLTRNELWVINKETESYGGTTVTYYNAGEPNQTSLWRKDQNSWHFMSLPTGIAFSENGNFATSPGVFDSNHGSGANYFTGPALWSSDSLVYAQPSGGNGSHLDMLHESPYCMGICAESGNAFWVFDGYHNAPVRYDFAADHGPGADDHSDGVIRRYEGLNLMPDPAYDIASHLVLDKSTNWLYIVDTGNDRVLRMNITSGMPMANLTSHEPVAEYTEWDMVTWETVTDTGLVAPSGIEIIGNHLLVSDHANGDIVVYDISGTPVETGRIHTNAAGIMGIKIGPDGRLWYVNAVDNEVVRLEPAGGMLPQAMFSSPATNVCVGSCVQFSNDAVAGESYEWIFDNGTAAITDTQSTPSPVCYAAPGVYGVTMIVTNAVGSDTLTVDDYLTVHPAPPQPVITQNGNQLSATTGYTEYQWLLNNNVITGAVSSAFEPGESGDYKVVVTDANGCESTSESFSFVSTAISTVLHKTITVYPNPADAYLNITTPEPVSVIEVMDASGRIVLSQPVDNQNAIALDISTLSAGVFLLKLHGPNGLVVTRFSALR